MQKEKKEKKFCGKNVLLEKKLSEKKELKMTTLSFNLKIKSKIQESIQPFQEKNKVKIEYFFIFVNEQNIND